MSSVDQFHDYHESLRLINELYYEGFSMTTVVENLRELHDRRRVYDFPILRMMNQVEERVRRENEEIKEQFRENRENRAQRKQREKGELIRYKVLSKQKLETVCDNQCVICHDKYTVKDMVITDCCSNFYCNPCLIQWTTSHNSCPTCRKERPTTMGFRQKAAPRLHQLVN